MLAIMEVELGRVTKFSRFSTQKEAEDHIAAFSRKYPDAFIHEDVPGNIANYSVSGQTLTFDPPSGPSESEKDAVAEIQVATPLNRAIRDALWELHEAINGNINLPNETKSEYTQRLIKKISSYS